MLSKKSLLFNITLAVLFVNLLILVTSCQKEHITEVDFEEAEFDSFVEPDFPFITTSIDGRELGSEFPSDNISVRCVAFLLGNDAYGCFDTDLLRWSVAWTGDFLTMGTMPQVSYTDYFNKGNSIPVVLGQPMVATGLYPGWMGADLDFSDPRPPSPAPAQFAAGPIPQDMGRWNGLYVHDNDVVLSYTVRNTDIHEMPGSVSAGDEVGITRTIKTNAIDESLTLIAADFQPGTQYEVTGNTAFIYHSADSVTAIGVAGASNGAEIKVTEGQYVTVHVPSNNDGANFKLVMWRGHNDGQSHFDQMLSEPTKDIPTVTRGGSNRWTETVYTRGKVSPDTAAYVVDDLTLPIPNPWKRNVRVVDIDFFDNNSAAAITYEGDVWLIDGIDEDLNSLRWTRFASGLYDTQSIEIVRDSIYVYGREGIVRLHDLNGNGSADYYENFSNLMEQSIETREWPYDMVTAPDGGFYVAKGAAGNAGPQVEEVVAQGFRIGSNHSGSILKISPDGRSVKTIATGMRGPYLGIHPEKGILTASDQQGNFVPSTPIRLVNEGDYYGVPPAAHQDPIPEITPPLTWIPHRVDQSGGGQVWLTDDRMGPLSGSLLHLSYARPGVFKVYTDSTGKAIQGGISLVSEAFPGPVMKGVVSPGDGQLYVAGFQVFGSGANTISALSRLRYTGLPDYQPESFRVRDAGVIIHFGVDLDAATAEDLSNYRVERWNYRHSGEYGSGHYTMDDEPGQDNMPIVSAHLSDDQKSVFLAVPNIAEVMQMQVNYQINAADGEAMDDAIYFSVKDVIEADLESEGFSNIGEIVLAGSVREEVASSTNIPVSIETGEKVFQRIGCSACHSTDGTTGGLRGPSLKGTFGSERRFDDGTTAVADEEYIKTAILNPGDTIVEGFEQNMPSFQGILEDEEIESLVLFIKSLQD